MKPSFVTFVGGWGDTPVERMMSDAHRAMVRDTLEQAASTGAFQQLVVVADLPDLAGRVSVEPPLSPFHFGRELRRIAHKYRMEKVFYVGGGALPLLSADRMAEIADQLAQSDDTVISNNPYSGDLIAFTPAAALDDIELPAIDNPLPRLLEAEAGLTGNSLPKDVTTLLDVDTPTDLAILSLYPSTGPNLREHLGAVDLDTRRIEQIARLMTVRESELLVAGRIGSYAWSKLEQETACRTRIISEERGMRTDGREARGSARSVLGLHIERVGPGRFFEHMAQLGEGVILDTRVLFSHLGLNLEPSDRYLSDMMQPDGIENEWLREFTQAAIEAPVPVVLGGHSLVSGGLLAMIDIAWSGHDSFDKV